MKRLDILDVLLVAFPKDVIKRIEALNDENRKILAEDMKTAAEKRVEVLEKAQGRN